MIGVFKSYFGGVFDEETVRNNFVLIYELLDECCDYGYPQNCASDVLKKYILQEGNKGDISLLTAALQKVSTVTAVPEQVGPSALRMARSQDPAARCAGVRQLAAPRVPWARQATGRWASCEASDRQVSEARMLPSNLGVNR